MACIAFFVGLWLFLHRRRAGVTTAVPKALIVIGLAQTALFIVQMRDIGDALRAVNGVAPADKATILAASISEAINCAFFDCLLGMPLLVGAWLIDRKLRGPPPEVLAPAQAAPPGARCATHADAAGTHVCSRCGAFMCAECLAADGARCAACLMRSPAR